MTGLELSTIARLGLNPIVLVLNNRGYSTERQIMDGPFNDITFWDFHRVPDLLGTGKGFVVHTVRDFRQALRASLDNRESYSIIDIHLDPYDISPALQRLGAKLGKRIRGKIE
jgi:indolepyruvate decarboxylase